MLRSFSLILIAVCSTLIIPITLEEITDYSIQFKIITYVSLVIILVILVVLSEKRDSKDKKKIKALEMDSNIKSATELIHRLQDLLSDEHDPKIIAHLQFAVGQVREYRQGLESAYNIIQGKN